MKVKEVYVEVKKSKNYQTYTVGKTFEIHNTDDPDIVIKKGQAECRKLVQEQIDIDNK